MVKNKKQFSSLFNKNLLKMQDDSNISQSQVWSMGKFFNFYIYIHKIDFFICFFLCHYSSWSENTCNLVHVFMYLFPCTCITWQALLKVTFLQKRQKCHHKWGQCSGCFLLRCCRTSRTCYYETLIVFCSTHTELLSFPFSLK